MWLHPLGTCKMSDKHVKNVRHRTTSTYNLCWTTMFGKASFSKMYLYARLLQCKQAKCIYFVIITIRFQTTQIPSLYVITKCMHFACLHINNRIIIHGMADAKFVICKMFVHCCRAHYVIKMLIFRSWQKRFLRLCIHNIYSQCMYNRALHTYINICTYPTCTGTETSCSRCVSGLATGTFSFTDQFARTLGPWTTVYSSSVLNLRKVV